MADYSRKNYLEEQVKMVKNQLDYLLEELEKEKMKETTEEMTEGNYDPERAYSENYAEGAAENPRWYSDWPGYYDDSHDSRNYR